MYVIKVGDYYVRGFNGVYRLSGDITLSQEIMRSFNKKDAEVIAQRVNGEIIKMAEEVTNEK